MKCPHCDYEEGYYDEDVRWVKGEHGNFYVIALQYTRSGVYQDEVVGSYACPACYKVFID